MQRQVDLTKIAQELVFLKSNMMKEQIRISASLKEKDIQIWKLEAELRKYKLDTKATSASNCCTCSPPSQSSAAYSPPSSTTCCSSEDSSPEQGCRVPRFQIRPPASLPPSVCLVPPSLPPPLYLGSRRRRSRLATTTTTTTPISSSNKSSQGVSGGGPDDAFICTPGSGLIKGDFEETSPPPSSRSSICSDIKDSGRDTEDSENIYEVIGGGAFEDDFRPPPPPPPPPRRKNNDPLPKFLREGGPSHKSAIISPSVTSTNHKNFLKPSDIKNRQQQQHNHRAKDSSCLLSCSVSAADLSIQEEHELSIVGGRVTQTTYWTGKRFL